MRTVPGACSAAGSLRQHYSGKVTFVKVNVDDEPQVASYYDVASIPTLLVFGPRANPFIARLGCPIHRGSLRCSTESLDTPSAANQLFADKHYSRVRRNQCQALQTVCPTGRTAHRLTCIAAGGLSLLGGVLGLVVNPWFLTLGAVGEFGSSPLASGAVRPSKPNPPRRFQRLIRHCDCPHPPQERTHEPRHFPRDRTGDPSAAPPHGRLLRQVL